ncbi:DUF6226 family protein [Nocardioides szechwanensis]|uniref:DUF6226 family protein n=1 Tax=Nocardioides szechwanensis TaxID=1005944 RepID=UPI00115FC79F|nr:DUF6226 family protein [Nocardioides szechwanensis]
MSSSTPPASPAWANDLVAQVNRVFSRTGADTPGRPDPHQGRPPAEEEYSRCLEAGKYRILDTRIEAWVQTLADRGIAISRDAPLSGPRWLGAVRPPEQHHRIQRIDPTAPGGLALWFARTLVDGAQFGVDVGVGTPTGRSEPPVLVDVVPPCGCDACDDGSEALLEAVDDWFVTVARGGVVHARDGERRITRTINGWQGTGDADEAWLDQSASPPPGLRQWSGEPWL